MRPINDTITSTQIALIQMASAHLKDLMRAMAGVGTGENSAARVHATSEEAELVRAVGDQQVLGLLVVIELILWVSRPSRLLVARKQHLPDRHGSSWSIRDRLRCRDRRDRPDWYRGSRRLHQAIDVSLAISIASSTVLKVVTETTGPKISSWKTRILLLPSNTVGWM